MVLYRSCGKSCQAKTDAFIAQHMDELVSAIKGTGIFFATIVAQKTLESGYGESQLAKKYNNYGGVKYGGGVWGATGSVSLDTTEVVRGSTVKTKASFAIYPSPLASFQGYIKVLQDPTKKYTQNGVFKSRNAIEQVERIVKSGYTTTPLSQYLDARMKEQIDYITNKYQIGLIS
jgi:flagellum-specific peptidoglycan hydrolase FlgJ